MSGALSKPFVETRLVTVSRLTIVAFIAAAAYWVARRPLGSWIIDDACITYAFAENLVLHGSFGAYPGGVAVEAYSTPLMFFLVVVLRAIHLFQPLETHVRIELVEFALLAALVQYELSFFSRARNRLLLSLLGTALFVWCQLMTPATLVWYSSGLEGLQLSLSLVLLIGFSRRMLAGADRPILEGVLLTTCALVRPESPLYVAVTCVATALAMTGGRRGVRRPLMLPFLKACAFGAAGALLFLAFRLSVFGFVLPNTYYAKQNHHTIWKNLHDYVLPSLLPYAQCSVLACYGVVLVTYRAAIATWFPILALALATLAMPLQHGEDWMGEHRFGVPLLTMAHFIFAAGTVIAFGHVLALRSRGRLLGLSAFTALLCALFLYEREGTFNFAKGGHVTAQDVAELEGFERVEIQRRLGLEWPVVGLPDIGGSLLVGRMQLLDTWGLGDLDVARIDKSEKLLLHTYEHFESRMDLAETHGTQGGRLELTDRDPLVKMVMGPAAREGHYKKDEITYYVDTRHVFDMAVAGRTGVVDTPNASIALSPRTVPLVVGGGVVRIELLVESKAPKEAPSSLDSKVDAADTPAADAPSVEPGDETLRVELGSDADELRELCLTTTYALPIARRAGHSVRQGFLLAAPRTPGVYPIRLKVLSEGAEIASAEIGNIRVVASKDFARAAAKDLQAVDAATPATTRAARVGQLFEQSRPMMNPSKTRGMVEQFRAASLPPKRATYKPFEGMRAAAEPWFLEPIPHELAGLVSGIHARACTEATAAWAASEARGESLDRRALEAARYVDELRRLGFLDLSSCPVVKRAMDSSAHDVPHDVLASYRLALARALLVPADVAAHKRRLVLRPGALPLLPPEELSYGAQ